MNQNRQKWGIKSPNVPHEPGISHNETQIAATRQNKPKSLSLPHWVTMIPNESYLFTISFNEPLWFTISDNEPHKAIRSTMSHNETQWAKINPNEQQRPNMSHTESRWVSIYLNNFIFLEWVTMRRNERQLVAMTHKS